MQSALQGAGIDAKCFTGHSFRIGAATFAVQVGFQDSTIKMLGRWESAAYLQYIQTPRKLLAAISPYLGWTRWCRTQPNHIAITRGWKWSTPPHSLLGGGSGQW